MLLFKVQGKVDSAKITKWLLTNMQKIKLQEMSNNICSWSNLGLRNPFLTLFW